MNKAKRIFWSVVIVLIIAVAVAAVIGITFLDKIVKTGVETLGPQITKVSVKLDDVHIGLLTCSAKIKGLVVGNPDGYKTSEAINIGLMDVGVNPASVLSDKIVVRSIRIDAPQITFEGGLGGNNLSKILDNVNATSTTTTPTATNATTKAVNKSGKKIEVDDFLLTNAKVHVSLTDMNGKELTLTLPQIHLTNLGAGTEGLTPAELTRAVLQEITTATVKAVSSAASGLGKDAVGIGVDKVKKGIGGLLGK